MSKRIKEPRAEFLDGVNLLVRGLHAVITDDNIRDKEVYEWVVAFPKYIEAMDKYFDPESDPLIEKELG